MQSHETFDRNEVLNAFKMLYQKFVAAAELYQEQINAVVTGQNKFEQALQDLISRWNSLSFEETMKIFREELNPIFIKLSEIPLPEDTPLAKVIKEVAEFPHIRELSSVNDVANVLSYISAAATHLNERNKKLKQRYQELIKRYSALADDAKGVALEIRGYINTTIDRAMQKYNYQLPLNEVLSKVEIKHLDQLTPPNITSTIHDELKSSNPVAKPPANIQGTSANIGLLAKKSTYSEDKSHNKDKKSCCLIM